MKTSTQLKALVRNLSKKAGVEAEILLRNFMLERFLERIAASKYKHNFILKGGMLIAAMVGIDTRTTMDMDASIKGQTLTASDITAIVEDILATPVDDGVEFTMRNIEEIREEADYPGFRLSIGAVLDKTKQTLKIDITTGDFVTPKEIEYNFKLMFEDRTISIMAYNLETVLAEKFETVINRSVTNTRMRDFYDIYILTTTQQFSLETFRSALKKTVEKRDTSEQCNTI
jgi:predicted nucleotidyltransferase component of viral defense system